VEFNASKIPKIPTKLDRSASDNQTKASKKFILVSRALVNSRHSVRASLLLKKYVHFYVDKNQRRTQEVLMNDHIYKLVELTGSSRTSVEDAVQNAIAKAAKTLHNIHWFQVTDTRGYIENNSIEHWQVTIKLGFRLDD
jgi:flavin-binding protein dodecin